MRKVVTVCGSLRFFEKIVEVAETLELERGWVVLAPIPHVGGNELTSEERALLGEIHRAKIDMSDAICVVNTGGYIGESVRAEIEYAQRLGKEILYLEE